MSCSICGSTEHSANDHKYCGICGSYEHSDANHPSDGHYQSKEESSAEYSYDQSETSSGGYYQSKEEGGEKKHRTICWIIIGFVIATLMWIIPLIYVNHYYGDVEVDDRTAVHIVLIIIATIIGSFILSAVSAMLNGRALCIMFAAVAFGNIALFMLAIFGIVDRISELIAKVLNL